MTKKKEKVKDVKIPKLLNNKQAATVVICLVLGFLIGYIASSYGGAASKTDVGSKVEAYVTENFLAPQGASAELISIDSNYGMYEIKFNILKDGEVIALDKPYELKLKYKKTSMQDVFIHIVKEKIID